MKYGSVPHFPRGISRLIIGSMTFRHDTKEASFALMDAAMEAGVNTVDLAHIYNGGQGHQILGEWIQARNAREKVVLFDKGCHHNRQGPQVTPDAIRRELDQNLAWLGVPQGDFFVFHRDNPEVPVGPLVETLNELRDAGKVQAWGASNWTVERVQAFNAYAEAHDLQGFSLSNPNLSLATVNEPMWTDAHTVKAAEREWHRETQFPLFAWSSQAGGYFFGVETPDVVRVYANLENANRRERVRQLASDKGVSVAALILAWALSQPYPVWALIGPQNPAELNSSLAGLSVRLPDDERDYLEYGS